MDNIPKDFKFFYSLPIVSQNGEIKVNPLISGKNGFDNDPIFNNFFIRTIIESPDILITPEILLNIGNAKSIDGSGTTEDTEEVEEVEEITPDKVGEIEELTSEENNNIINTISNGDRIITIQNKPVTDEIKSTEGDIFILPDNNPEGRIYINMEPLKNILVVPNNVLTIIDKKTGKEIFNQELNAEGAAIFEAVQGRLFVVANINGQLVPFYKSSAGTSGKIQGA